VTRQEVTNYHEYGHSVTRWPAIERVDGTAEHLFIFLGSASAHIAPLRDLRTAADRQTFVDTVKRFFETSRSDEFRAGAKERYHHRHIDFPPLSQGTSHGPPPGSDPVLRRNEPLDRLPHPARRVGRHQGRRPAHRAGESRGRLLPRRQGDGSLWRG